MNRFLVERFILTVQQKLWRFLSLLYYGARIDRQWTDIDDFCDCLYWYSQLLSISLGVIYGWYKFVGFKAIVTHFAFTWVLYKIFVTVHTLDENEDFNGLIPTFVEVCTSAFITFILAWMVFYTITVNYKSINLYGE